MNHPPIDELELLPDWPGYAIHRESETAWRKAPNGQWVKITPQAKRTGTAICVRLVRKGKRHTVSMRRLLGLPPLHRTTVVRDFDNEEVETYHPQGPFIGLLPESRRRIQRRIQAARRLKIYKVRTGRLEPDDEERLSYSA